MSYFQNVFTSSFEGNWLLGDRHHIPKFVCPSNAGRGDEHVVAWVEPPYNLSGTDSDSTNSTDTLNIVYAINDNPRTGMTFKNWSVMSIDITVAMGGKVGVTSESIMADLNNDAIFSERFEASLQSTKSPNGPKHVMIKQKKDSTQFRFYIQNGQAEDVLQFNQRAGVGQLPTFFDRHTRANRFIFSDSQNHLIALDPSNGVDARIIDDAVNAFGISLNLDSSSVKPDWELLAGRSGLFEFTNVVDGSTTIVYPAGAVVGDLAKLTISDSSHTFVMPYTLESGDLITPP
jgi:hypothetical protein